MKRILLSFLSLLCLSFIGYSQCVVNAGQTISDQCSGQIVGGVLSGTVELNTSASLPSGTVTSLGDVAFDITSNSFTLTLGDDLGIESGATISFDGTGQATIAANGTTFNKAGNAPGGSFGELGATLSSCTDPGGCTIQSTLPVTLLSWTARPVGEAVELAWSTGTELDNEFYQIDHSYDGVLFEEMVRVNGVGNSSEVVNYTYEHRKAGGGTHFYRLSQQDFDGTRTTFGIISVNVKAEDDVIFPNPVAAGGSLQFTPSDRAASVARLYDGTGRVVSEFALNQNGPTQTIVPADLAGGVYLLRYGQVAQRILVRR